MRPVDLSGRIRDILLHSRWTRAMAVVNINWGLIIDRIRRGRCIPFLGAGVNAKSDDPENKYEGLPLGGGVAAHFFELLTGGKVRVPKLPKKTCEDKFFKSRPDLLRLGLQDLARVSLHLLLENDAPYLRDRLREILPDEERKPSRLLCTLADIKELKVIITTNYDRLMEKALDEKKRPYKTVVQPIGGFDVAVHPELNELETYDGVILYKIHGTFCEEGAQDLVLTEEDYIEFLTVASIENQGVPRPIAKKLGLSTLLFLGYGLEDWDFRVIFHALIRKLPVSDHRKSFAIQKKPSKFWTDYWDDKGVEIYDYDLYQFANDLAKQYKDCAGGAGDEV